MYQQIQDCKRLTGNKKKTAERLGLARGTVQKFWNMSEQEYQAYCRRASIRRHRFDAYRKEIITLIELNASDGEQIHGSSIYDVLEERHGVLPGTERTLRNYVQALKDTGAVELKKQKPLRRPQEESKLGDQCQIDFGEYRISRGRKAYIYAAVLAASRARYVAVQDHPFRTVEVIRHTLDAFRYFGGRPRVLVIDQDKLMTVSENSGEIRHTADFEHFIQEQDLAVWLCRKADPQSKGKVENAVKFVKTSFFSARTFDSVQDIHEPLSTWLTRRANGKIHQATGRIPARVLELEERKTLRTIRSSIYDQHVGIPRDTRKANSKGMIAFAGNSFSVPQKYAERTVAVQSGPVRLRIYDMDSGSELCSHPLPEGKGHNIVSEGHRVKRGSKPREVYDKLADRVELPGWKAFLDANLERYQRYWKDQSVHLARIAETASELDILDSAISFCESAECYGAGDLKSAYEHLCESRDTGFPSLLEQARPMISIRTKASSEVAKRGIRYYISALSLVLGVPA
ncbi:hypothetical protein AU468_11715 [Alkalispirochaeta sphaeroplastigenens]|uniref:Integrase catalytic domain-containing protein n=1 Tax=Alkalispirochaeta sphaeroplastigenens TaxID=1187066 RepID=A0A2S4JH56_9SPIO|nr:hypothetical protein AU468_11715 [Alkalispirochaeta sphaeroplastigenens]